MCFSRYISTVLCEPQMLTFMDKSCWVSRAEATQRGECVYFKPQTDTHSAHVHICWEALYYLQIHSPFHRYYKRLTL